MRPRKSVNVASIVGSPEEEESRPNLRLRVVGVVVLLLFGVLVLRLWTLQVVEGKTYAAAVTREPGAGREHPGPAWRDRRSQRHRPGVEHPAAGDPALAAPRPRRTRASWAWWPRSWARRRRRCRRPSTTTSTAPTSRCPWPSACPPPPCSSCRPTRRSTRASACRRWRSAPIPRAAPRPPTSWATSATSPRSYLAAHPNDGYTQGSQIGVSGIEAQYEPYLRGVPGARPSPSTPAATVVGTLEHHRTPDRRHRRAQHRHGLQQRWRTTCRRRSWPTARHPTRSTGASCPPAPNGAVIVMNPQNGQVLAMASYPTTTSTSGWAGISSANFAALQRSRRGEQQRHRGPVHPGIDLQARHGDRRAPGRAHRADHALRRHRAPTRSRAARRPASTTTPGCILHDDPGDSGGTYNVSGALTVSSDAFFYNLGEMFWQSRGQYGDTPIQNEAAAVRRGDDHRHRPSRGGAGTRRQLPRSGPSCTPRRPRRSRTRRRGSPATTSKWPSGRVRRC